MVPLGCTVCKNELMICGSFSGTSEFSHGKSTALCLLVHTQGHVCENRFYHSIGKICLLLIDHWSVHIPTPVWNSSVWNVVKFHYWKVQLSPRQQPSQATVEIRSLWHLLRETDKPHATRGNRSPLWATSDSSNFRSARRPPATDQAKQTIPRRWE